MSVEGEALARRLQSRAGTALRRALGLADASEIRIRRPPSGRGGRTFILEADGAPAAVLRALRSRRRVLRLKAASDRLVRLHVPVARVLWSDASLLGRLRRGAYLLLEEHLHGVTLGRLADHAPALDSLAGALARLHAVRRPEWGTLRSGKSRRFGRYRLAQIRSLLRRLRRAGALSGSEARALADAFEAWRGRLDSLREFHLIHNDLHFENVLVSGDGSVSLIDLYRLRFDRRERELAAVAGRLLDLEPRASRAFLEAYARRAGAQPEEGLLELETAALCLARWAALRERARLQPPGEQRRSFSALARLWEERARERAARMGPVIGRAAQGRGVF